MRDVARYASVSTATVSRVINRPDMVDASTRQRVQDAITTLGYQINPTAQSLRKQQTRRVLLVTPALDDPLLAAMVGAFQQAAHQADYEVVLDLSPERPDTLPFARYDGLCWARYQPLSDDPGLPYTQLATEVYATAAWEATQYLARLGHRHIALIAHAEDARWQRWQKGYADALTALGLTPSYSVTLQPDALMDTVQTWVHSHEAPSAIITSSDALAASVCRRALALGLSLPEMLSVIGLGDTPLARWFAPALTTVYISGESLGHQAFVALYNQMNPQAPLDTPPLSVPKLIMRDSATPPFQASQSIP